MLPKWNLSLVFALLVLGLVSLVGLGVDVTPASAQEFVQDETCHACHKDLYMLKDIGKAFCLCQDKMTCTTCHGGVTGTWDADEAHTGMVARPVGGEQMICEMCHDQAFMDNVAQFSSVAGVQPTHPPLPTCTPAPLASQAGVPTLPAASRFSEPGRLLGLGVVTLGFVGIIILTLFFTRQDRAAR
jgi:hypothetical protein